MSANKSNSTRAHKRAKAEAEAAAIRERHADYQPANVRTYGEPWDSIIAAGAKWAVPPSGSPRSNDKIVKGAR